MNHIKTELQQRRIRQIGLNLLVICSILVLIWLSQRYTLQYDFSASHSNSLALASQQVLDSLSDSIHIDAYIKPNQELKQHIALLLKPYLQYSDQITLRFIDIDSEPQQVRQYGIQGEGALLVHYQGRTEKINTLNESNLTNTLLRLANTHTRGVAFLSGHQERNPHGDANYDLSQFSLAMQQLDINVFNINLASIAAIPENVSLFVIAGLYTALPTNEFAIIKSYVLEGGNLLWLSDPDEPEHSALQNLLGIQRISGTLLDRNSVLYGLDYASHVLITEYPQHQLTKGFETTTLFPVSSALQPIADATNRFQQAAIMETLFSTWSETATIDDSSRYDENSQDSLGPLTLAYALTREVSGKQQRILVVGDGDFLSNAFIYQLGNLKLGLRMVNWLTYADQFIDIAPKHTIDHSLQLSPLAVSSIGYGFLLILPGSLFISGLFIWRRRKFL